MAFGRTAREVWDRFNFRKFRFMSKQVCSSKDLITVLTLPHQF